jgi:outer membrane protein TolC
MMSADELNYKVLRQNVLVEAKRLLIDYIYLMKKKSIANKRLEFANDIYSASLIRLETGDVNLLEVNKAKLHLMKVKKEAKEVQSALISVKENLIRLNGGNDVKLELENYIQEGIVSLDSLLFEKIDSDPELLLSQKQFEASQKQLKVTKNMQLPAFNLGYGTETVADEKFKGVIVGVSVPLWSSKRSIQQAKIETEYYDLTTDDLTEKKIAETKILHNKVSTLKDNLDSYEAVLSSVNNEALLKQSLESGEISIIDFFTEMFYYYEIYDDFLLLEKDYHQAIAELYKYRL